MRFDASDLRALPFGHLGKAVGPTGATRMRGRCIDDLHLGILDERDRLARRVVRQAQDHSIDAFSSRLRSSASLRFSGSIETSSMSRRPSSRSRICRPVVPASPSMKTFAFGPPASCRPCSCRLEAGAPKTKGRFGCPKRPSRNPNSVKRLALRELEAASGLLAAVLLALDHAAVAGQEACGFSAGRSAGS